METTFIGYIVTISDKVSDLLPTEIAVLRYCQRYYHQSYRHGLLSSDIKINAIAENGTAYRLQVFENGNTWSLEQIWKEVTNG